jgi:hypothetical protein
MGAAEIFTFPWPGPGNSEGPVDPEGWMDVEVREPTAEVDLVVLQPSLVATSPWPGPGDSEG